MLRRAPTCPAALVVAGASPEKQGVVCRVMQQDVEDESGVGMSAGRLGYLQHEATGGVYLTMESDPSTVTGFCHGDALPVITDEDGQGRASYSFCETWQAEKKRIAEGKRGLYDQPEPESVSMGISEPQVGRSMADLDELAGIRG